MYAVLDGAALFRVLRQGRYFRLLPCGSLSTPRFQLTHHLICDTHLLERWVFMGFHALTNSHPAFGQAVCFLFKLLKSIKLII